MPMVIPVSELQRNGAEIVNTAMKTKEPIYLTRRGYKSVVVIDADEYDRMASGEEARVRKALATKDALHRAHQEVEQGDVVPLEEAAQALHERWDAQ